MKGASLVPPRSLTDLIAERAADLRRRIADRTDRDVRIVCVTKGHPIDVARAAFAAGLPGLTEATLTWVRVEPSLATSTLKPSRPLAKAAPDTASSKTANRP